ncbi:MAG: adenine phosphoribosyltransferase [Steroidobacteraceae bacterium]
MTDLKTFIRDIPDFPKPGVLFRDISPLLRDHLPATLAALDALLDDSEWRGVDAIAGIESRGFILGAALAVLRGKGFVLVRKAGRLPPPVVSVGYQLEYGSAVLEMQRGSGRLLLVDDVCATGGTLTAAAQLCRDSGHKVIALATLIDLAMVPAFNWQGLALRSALNYG